MNKYDGYIWFVEKKKKTKAYNLEVTELIDAFATV